MIHQGGPLSLFNEGCCYVQFEERDYDREQDDAMEFIDAGEST